MLGFGAVGGRVSRRQILSASIRGTDATRCAACCIGLVKLSRGADSKAMPDD